jgi:cytochrome c oxidase cbb3-type subunit 4
MNIENLIFDARNIVTVLSLLSFLGIVFWAYSASRKPAFEEAARLPFADEPGSREEEYRG